MTLFVAIAITYWYVSANIFLKNMSYFECNKIHVATQAGMKILKEVMLLSAIRLLKHGSQEVGILPGISGKAPSHLRGVS